MTTRTFAIVMTTGVVVAALLLALGGALDAPGLEYAGAGAVLVVMLARVWWEWRPRRTGTRAGASGSGRTGVAFAAALAAAVLLGFLAQRIFGGA